MDHGKKYTTLLTGYESPAYACTDTFTQDVLSKLQQTPEMTPREIEIQIFFMAFYENKLENPNVTWDDFKASMLKQGRGTGLLEDLREYVRL